MSHDRRILAILNDAKFHTAEALAEQLKISRTTVGKLVHDLQAWGLEIHAIRGRGYCLATSVELLDHSRIMADLTDAARDLLNDIEIHQRIDSTNTYLMDRAQSGLASGSICLAELQAAGRGRRGKPWVSPFAANLYLSLLWRFPSRSTALSSLSLVTGVAVSQALQDLGVAGIGLKWPNDLLWQRRKLGGILLEASGELSGPCYVVAGVGLNIAMPLDAETAIDQPWIDLRAIVGPDSISRNRLAARIASEMLIAFARFEQNGFEAISQAWARFDLVMGQRVMLKLFDNTITGIARGVDESGALLLETADGGIRRFTAGEVSLRFDG